MTEQEQIEEMAKVICENYGTNYCKEFCGIATCSDPVVAQDIYNQGYRKANDVIDEFVERLLDRFAKTETIANCLHGRTNTEIDSIIKIVAAEMRKEFEK